MNLSDLCTSYITSTKLKDETERNILEFCEAPWGLGMGSVLGVPPLYPVQRFILKCYYNILLDDKDHRIIIKDRFNEKELHRYTEMDYLKFLQDQSRINIAEVSGDPKDIRPNLELVIGRRGTKTSTIGILVSYETYKLLRKLSPQHYYNMMPDDEIRISCIATQQDQASELFRRISGHLERSDYFKKYRNKPTLTYMQLSTQRDIEQYGDGMRPSIRLVAAPSSGRGLRGHNNIVAVLDELAHFFESESADDKSDEVIYDAVTPSVARFNSPEGEPHGKIICISSPMNRAGKFWDLYQRSLEADCNDILMIKAPTWEVDYTLSSKVLRAKYAENPVTYMTEYGAEFSDRVRGWIENEQYLRVNIIPGLRLKNKSYERVPHFAGVDIGLKGDGSAIAICHVTRREFEGGFKDFIELDCVEARYAEIEGRENFRPEEMAEWIASFGERFFIVKGIMDQYFGLAIMPVLVDKGMKQFSIEPMTRDLNSRIYQNLMSKMLDCSLRIPEAEEHQVDGKATKDIDLVTEMLRLQVREHSKYLIEVAAPQVKNAHDDISDAYARTVFLATEYMSKGGGNSKNPITESTSASRMSYRKYMMKQKRNMFYTARPSSSLQREMTGGRMLSTALDRIATPLGGGRRMWR